ncbi:methyl-accepting chemotaxis protein [Dongia rigui]|uniref:Methyl-accepting chemotaxis protein n=1 Tax=Dongia rigui TaxID=940149 RepID=A0ABU5E4N7_9PROT|nr:methyl-accepting chemotaxis protein [Dongia rigui]MDY0874491.1 methyl-accepting chemotaxis protein [Dongia rigui]
MRLNEPITDREILLDADRPIVSKTDAGGRITFVNQAFIDISGFEEAELMGQPHNIVRHPHMPKGAFADLWRACKRGDSWTGLVKNRTKLGDFYWVRANVSPIYDGDKISGYLSIRTKPTREEVAAAGKIYAQFQAGTAKGLTVEDGQVVKDGKWHRLRQKMQNFRIEVFSALALLAVAVGLMIGSGLWALSRIDDAMQSAKAESQHLVDKAIPLLAATKDIRFDVVQIQQWLTDISATQGKDGLNDGFDTAAAFKEALGKDVARAKEIATDLNQTEIVQALDDVLAASGPYYDMGVTMAQAFIAEGPAGGNKIMGDFDATAEKITGDLDKLSLLTTTYIDTERDDAGKALVSGTDLVELIFKLSMVPIVVAVFALILAILAVGHVARVIGQIARSTDRAASGQKVDVIPGIDRKDEIGMMAKAVKTFTLKVHFADLEREEFSVRANRDRTVAMSDMANKVESETGTAVRSVADLVGEMTQGAGVLRDAALAVTDRSHSVSGASQQALGNAQLVAASAEELSASIREISGQVTQTTAVSRTAVETTEKATAAIGELTTVVQQISQFASIIQDVANQTNLLALNATIEAARAGEAGKGFAVVANEVKNLAAQTSRSTEEIGRTVARVLQATDSAAEAVRGIGDQIRQVDGFAASIATAIEEQAAATAEISRNIAETATSTGTVTEQMKEVSDKAEDAQKRALEVSDLSGRIQQVVHALQNAVVHSIRTVTTEVDRGADDRLQHPIPGRAMVGDKWIEASILNISRGGAAFELKEDMGKPPHVRLEIQDVDAPLEVQVIASTGTMLRGTFERAAASRTTLPALLERLRRKGALKAT